MNQLVSRVRRRLDKRRWKCTAMDGPFGFPWKNVGAIEVQDLASISSIKMVSIWIYARAILY